ncbi:hypothetical protein J6V85_03115 [Candidatus Saccharibacteria bacterium]|nr:hypothetical protein [Candidatus Saccharibacteria bacterium]
MGGLTGIFRLDAGLFESGTSAAYLIWQNMMVFANVGMIIILLLIIFSQITGYGIDNYGIKKMLPKLIISAVLINLSFFACQIAVDLSNIVGRGMVDLSKNIYSNVMAQSNITAGDWIERGFGFLFTQIFLAGAGAAAAGGVIITAISLGPLWFIPLLFVVLIGLIAFIIFFLLLATRQLLAVILVAVSPLAMLCYILPNTQKLWKKWLDLFKSVLIIYPVCGALYGISKLMKLVAYSADGTHILMVMVAMLMTFVPLIAAPSLIKKSLAAFGEVGGMIQRMGDKMKGGVRTAEGFVRDSAIYKNAQRDTMLGRAQKNIDAYKAVQSGNATRRQKMRSILAGGERGFARNAALVERGKAEDIDATRMAIRDETGNYNVDIMGEQLHALLDTADQRDLTKSEKNKVQALSSQLAVTAGGARMIAKATEGKTGRSAQIMGEYMAQNNSVKNSLSSKSQRTSSRLSDIAAGAIKADTTQAQYDSMNNEYLEYRRKTAAKAMQTGTSATFLSEDDWKAANPSHSNQTVVQAIANDLLDKDKDLVTQRSSEVQELLKHVDQDRVDRMASNPNLFSYGDVAEGAQKAVSARASTAYVNPTSGEEIRVRSNVDENGAVQSYSVNDGSGWQEKQTSDFDISQYTLKSEYEKQQKNQPKVTGTRTLTHNDSGQAVRVKDMSDGSVIDIDSGQEVDIRNYHQNTPPSVTRTRVLSHNITDQKIRVREMSNGKVYDIDSGNEIDIRNYNDSYARRDQRSARPPQSPVQNGGLIIPHNSGGSPRRNS